MANNQNNVQPKVVTTTTTTTRRRGGRRRRRTPRTSAPNTTTVRKVTTTRQPSGNPRRRRNRFGKSRGAASGGIRQKITATLGTVGSNQGSAIEMEMSSLLNPLLMKETTGSNQYGPLQIHASTYNLWKLDYLLLKLTPMVGASAVSGTAVRASIDLSGQPGTPSWSALGARMHKDTSPGRQMTFYINGNYLKGPKEGWYYCNTKNDPKMCIAGAIQIHTLGKTMSTFTNTPFDAPLFLVELTGQWSFKNYNPQPGLLNLVKTEIKEEPQNIKIHSKPGEPILISIPDNTTMARMISQIDVNADATPSEIIWQICDAAITTAIDLFPPPFTWLFKSGWWFVKRVANKKKNADSVDGEPNPGELTFQVYQSINDAQNDVPCISTGQTSTKSTTLNKLQLMQITPGNIGLQQETVAGLRRTAGPTTDPIQIYSPSLFGEPALYGSTVTIGQRVPVAAICMQAVGGAQKVYTYSLRELLNPGFVQNGDIVDITVIDLPTYPIYQKDALDYSPIGDVYAAHFTTIGSSRPVQWTTVLWRANISKQIRMRGHATPTDQFLFFNPQLSMSGSNLPTTTYGLTVSSLVSLVERQEEIIAGKWYLSTFVAFNGRREFDNYGIPFYLSLQQIDTQQGNYDPTTEAYDVGAMLNTATPLKLHLNAAPNSVLTTSELNQLRQLLSGTAVAYLPAKEEETPTEYGDLEEEEDEPQGAVGGVESSIGSNRVEFDYRKRPPTPFSPIEEEDEDDEESDLDDDSYAEIPTYIKNLLIPEAKKLLDDLKKMGLSHEKAAKAAQGAYPHPAVEIWEVAYHNALADGLSPPSARDCAWGAVSDYLP
nr:ORF2 [Porcine astrovirus 4]